MLIDWLLVWWWWAWGRSCCRSWGWWGWGWVVHCESYDLRNNQCIIIGSWGVWQTTCHLADCWKWGDSCFWSIVAYGWGWGGGMCCCTVWSPWGNGWSWGWASSCTCAWWTAVDGQWKKWATGTNYLGSWWGWYTCPWKTWCYCSYTTTAACYWGIGWCGYCSDISWTAVRYANGWSWWGCKSTPWMCGGGAWGCYTSACACWKNATTPWSWGGGAWNNACKCPWWNGADGIFIARYPTACWYNITWGCKYTCGDYTIHCFTSNWTLEIH